MAALVHTRLSILDRSDAGRQPMGIAEHGVGGEPRWWITFNGEIYNFRELRCELADAGVVFRSQSDTEVILRLFERDGPGCVNRLRGMFAFAIWDEVEQSLFVARDAFGVKPLYYAETEAGFVFASEVRALLAGDMVARQLEPEALLGYFLYGSVPEPLTLVRGVQVLPPAHWLRWSRGRVEKRAYWSWEFSAGAMSSRDAVQVVRESLIDSVRHHFISDVPVGLFLSGGIDSTALLALSHLAGFRHVPTFCIRFADARFDEGLVAETTARYFNSEHKDWVVDGATGRGLFAEFLEAMDQPSIDGFNTFTVSRLASQAGMKVVLSGLGGDEMFGGYPSFQRIPEMMRWSQRMEFSPSLRRMAGGVLGTLRSGRMRRLGGFLKMEPSLRGAHRAFRGVFAWEDAVRLVRATCGEDACGAGVALGEEPRQPTMEDGVAQLEIELYLRNQLLRDSDVMSMASGLELRVPMVDRRLMEVLLPIRSEVRVGRGKQLLLDALPEIPAWVREQPKRGFLFPFEEWLHGDWHDVFVQSSANAVVPVNSWFQKWSLFVLGQVCRRMGLGEVGGGRN